MTLLPEVRRQLNEAAARQASGRSFVRPLTLRVGTLRRRPRISFSHLALVMSVVVVAAVAAAFLSSHGSTPTASRGGDVVGVVFRADPTPQSPLVTEQALARTVAIFRQRLGTAFRDFSVTRSLAAGVAVVVRHPPAGARARILALSRPARLYFYDWEADALTSNGKSAASQLAAGKPNPILISQGSGSAAPGSPGAGSMSLFDAVKLASRQKHPPTGSFNSRLGQLYYMFGASGSTACATAGNFYGFTPRAGEPCLLSGPQPTIQDLATGLPPGISTATGEVLSVPQGIVVLQAAPASFADAPNLTDPSSQFFVLTDHVAVLGSDITNPKQGTDSAGAPDVSFGFTPSGNQQFASVTGRIAKRGAADSGLGEQLDQHFAVVLDTQLISVPSIDFKQYPNGIIADAGADITSGFTIHSARDLATQLRSPLPLQLTPTS